MSHEHNKYKPKTQLTISQIRATLNDGNIYSVRSIAKKIQEIFFQAEFEYHEGILYRLEVFFEAIAFHFLRKTTLWLQNPETKATEKAWSESDWKWALKHFRDCPNLLEQRDIPQELDYGKRD